MSQFPLPVGLKSDLSDFIQSLETAKSLYRKFKGEVEGDPVHVGGVAGGGGGTTAGTGASPPMVMKAPQFAYQGGGHAGVAGGIAGFGPGLKGNLGGIAQALQNVVATGGAVGAQAAQQLAAMGIGAGGGAGVAAAPYHSMPWKGVGYVRHSNAYNSPIGPPRAPQYTSPIGPPSPWAGANANQYTSPIGPPSPWAGANANQYTSPIGPSSPWAGANANQYLSPIGPVPASAGGGTQAVSAFTKRAAATIIFYAITREVSAITSLLRSSAAAGQDFGGQAAAVSAATKAGGGLFGDLSTIGIDVTLAQTKNQLTDRDAFLGRATSVLGSRNSALAASQGSNSTARNLAAIEGRRQQNMRKLLGNAPPIGESENEYSWGGAFNAIVSPGLYFGGFSGDFGNTYDEGAHQRNRAAQAVFRGQQNAQRDTDNAEASADARNTLIDARSTNLELQSSIVAKNYANQFQPRAGAAYGILGQFNADAFRYQNIQNPTLEDTTRFKLQAAAAKADIGGIQHDVTQQILGAQTQQISPFESPLEYRDMSKEDLPSVMNAVLTSINGIQDILAAALNR